MTDAKNPGTAVTDRGPDSRPMEDGQLRSKVAAAGDRAAYADVGQAGRAMIQRLMAVEQDLPRGDLKVGLAVVSLVALWSRVSDHLSREQVAEVAACNAQTAGKALTRLHRLGVLTWVPATHKGGRSTLSMLPPEMTVVSGQGAAPETTVVSAPETTVVSLPRSHPEKKTGDPHPLVGEAPDGDADDDGENPPAEIIDQDEASFWACWVTTALGVDAVMPPKGRQALARQMLAVPSAERQAVAEHAARRRPPRQVREPSGLVRGRIDRAIAAVVVGGVRAEVR